MKYIHLLKTEQEFTNKYYGEEYLEPWVSLTDTENEHVDYNKRMATVDLGLPSGNLWAAYNLGATSSAETGDYYAWAELETKDYFSRNTYKYYDQENTSYTKYRDSQHTSLLLEDDAANVKLGGGWQIPSRTDFQELLNNCDFTSTFDAGLGTTYTKVTSQINGNSIAILNGGFYYDNHLNSDEYFFLWLANDAWGDCSSPAYEDVNIGTGSSTEQGYTIDSLPRYAGAQIRPVLKLGS